LTFQYHLWYYISVDDILLTQS